jgi:membrane protease subunit HflK
MQPAKPPDEVKSAFDDAIKAREDKERLENKAEAYANQILPQARGEAARVVADAKAYKEKVIAESEGDASRFLAILAEYEKAPLVTRERLYLDAVENVLANTSKVMLDVKEGNNLMLMPLDKMLGRSNATVPTPPPFQMDPVTEGPPQPAPLRESNRGRRSR